MLFGAIFPIGALATGIEQVELRLDASVVEDFRRKTQGLKMKSLYGKNFKFSVIHAIINNSLVIYTSLILNYFALLTHWNCVFDGRMYYAGHDFRFI